MEPTTDATELSFVEAQAVLSKHSMKLATAKDDLEQAERDAAMHTSPGRLAVYETDTEKDAVRSRWQRHLEQADADAMRITETIQRDTGRIHRQLESPGALSLSDGEWLRVGSMAPIVERKARTAPLAEVLAEVRGAFQRGDRAAMAAWLDAGRERLRTPSAKTEDGRVPMPEADTVRADLYRLLGQIKDGLADTSAKPLKERLAKVVGQSGDLAGRVTRRRAERELAAEVASGKRIPFPTRG
jgi:hypothetical protein